MLVRGHLGIGLAGFVSRTQDPAKPTVTVTHDFCEGERPMRALSRRERRQAAEGRWETIRYALDSTSRTVRLCVIVLVLSIPPGAFTVLLIHHSWVIAGTVSTRCCRYGSGVVPSPRPHDRASLPEILDLPSRSCSFGTTQREEPTGWWNLGPG